MKKKNIKNNLIMAFFSLAIIVMLALLVFLSFMGFFRLAGIPYESYTVLLFYVLLVFFISFFLEIFAKLLEAIVVPNTDSKVMIFFKRLIIHATANWFALFTAGEFISGIDVPLHFEVIIAVLLFLIEEVFDDKYKKKKVKK